MTKLIINADDFGLSRGANFGIIDAHKRGVIKSTSIMANMPGFSHAVELLKDCPDLGCGVHLTLTAHKPVLNTHKTIVDSNGHFYRRPTPSIFKKIDLDEIYNEFCAQIEKVKDAGIEITHLDSHHHIHTQGFLKPVMEKLLKKYPLPLRGGLTYDLDYPKVVPYKHYFYENTVGVEVFKKNLKDIKSYDVVDTMSHPAYIDQFIMKTSSYNVQRAKELEVLTSSELKEFFEANDIEVTNYRNI